MLSTHAILKQAPWRMLLLPLLGSTAAVAQTGTTRDTVRVSYPAARCPSCAAWNAPQAPFRITGNTYYVGTRGLSVILITSDSGHILIDGGLPVSPDVVLANVTALGFNPGSIKAILNSHAHHDHAGGIAALQRATGATVYATAWSAGVLRTGVVPESDPQFDPDPTCHECALPYPPVASVREIRDQDTVKVGPLRLVAHLTAGHTPGGTSWTWRSCDGTNCADVLYADSQTPVSANHFLFTRNSTYPTALDDFRRGADLLEKQRCTVLLTPHPGASSLFQRIAARDSGNVAPLHDAELCRTFVTNARAALTRRIDAERSR